MGLFPSRPEEVMEHAGCGECTGLYGSTEDAAV